MYDITVKVTDNCNFRCDYCIFSKEPKKSKDLDFISFAYFLDYFGPQMKNLTFSGGEPLLRFNEISVLIRKIRNEYPHIKINIMTNGSLLNDRIIGFLKKFEVQIIISIDGNKKYQDLNRHFLDSSKSTYDVILNNLKNIDCPFSVVMTVHPSNCHHLFYNFRSILKLKPVNIFFTPVMNANWNENDLINLKKNLRKIVLLYKNLIKKSNLRISILDLIGHLRELEIKKAMCFEKCGEHLYLDLNGNLYVCGSCVFSESLKKSGFIMNVSKSNLKSLNKKLERVQRSGIMPCLKLKNNNIKNQNVILEIFVSEANLLLKSLKKDEVALEKVKDILIGGTKNKNTEIPKKGVPKKMFIYITNKCNLRCNYCYLKKGDDAIDLTSCKKAIELLFESKGNNKYLRFMGGEPFLEWNILKEAIDYARILESRYKKRLSMEIATNGTIMKPGMIRHLEKRQVDIHLSIDGTEETHNLNRGSKNKSVYPIIINNLELLKKSNIKIKCNMVITPNTCNKILKNIIYLISLNIKHISFEPAVSNYWKEEDLIKLNENLKLVSVYYQNFLIKKGVCIDYFDGINLFPYLIKNKLFNRFFSFGCERHLTINAKGDIINCPCYPDEEDSRYILGNIKKDPLNKLKNKNRIKKIYFENNKNIVFCKKDCLKVLIGPKKTQKKSQKLHRFGVIEPRFYHYRYMINYNLDLFKKLCKNQKLDYNKIFLDIMPHPISKSEFLIDNSIFKFDSLKKRGIRLIDLNKVELNDEFFMDIQNDKEKFLFRGFLPFGYLKKLSNHERAIQKSKLAPESCIGCANFFKIENSKVMLCGGLVIDVNKFNLNKALIKVRDKCKSCQCLDIAEKDLNEK